MLLMASVADVVLVVRIVLLALMVVASVFVMIAVLKQAGNSEGISAVQGNSETDSFYAKNNSKRKESRLKLWTIIAAAVLGVCSIVYFILAL